MRGVATLLFLGLGLTTGTYAQPGQQSGHAEHHSGTAGETESRTRFTDGEVRKVDKDAQKVTLRHGPIPNLDMPEMTMVFRAHDPKMLEGLKPGDKVRFKADKVDGRLTITRIETTR